MPKGIYKRTKTPEERKKTGEKISLSKKGKGMGTNNPN